MPADIKSMLDFCLDEASKQNNKIDRRMYINIARSLIELDSLRSVRCCPNGWTTNITPVNRDNTEINKYYTVSCSNGFNDASKDRNGN